MWLNICCERECSWKCGVVISVKTKSLIIKERVKRDVDLISAIKKALSK
jgi:hypothetical protein